MIVCAASNNAGKLKELRRILERMGHEVKSLQELGIDLDPEETGTTFAENARIKAEAFCKASGLPTVADDSGLCTDALHGAPGVYSARYAGHHGDDDANNAKLLRELADVPEEQRSAKFVSAVCFMLPDGRALEVEGECPGRIAFTLQNGDYGFGYDPLFIPDEYGTPDGKRPNTERRSYAQLTPDEKDAISHRGRAMEKLAEKLGIVKERVAIRGQEVMQTITFELENARKDAMMVTPIGICLSYYVQSNNFIFVEFNGERVKLYDNGKLSVTDAAMQMQFPNDQLFPRKGEALLFTVNGKTRMVRGEQGEAAVIRVNGDEADMYTQVHNGDRIVVTPSTEGEPAVLELGKLSELGDALQVYVNGKQISLPKTAEVNGHRENEFYRIGQNDDIRIRNSYTVKEIAEFLDVPLGADIRVNDTAAQPDTRVYEHFTVSWDMKNPLPEGSYADLPDADTEEDAYREEPVYGEGPVMQKAEAVAGEAAMTQGTETAAENGTASVTTQGTSGKQDEKYESVEQTAQSQSVSPQGPHPLTVIVNHSPITMQGKASYVFVDVFDYIDFDLGSSASAGRSIVTNLNGRPAQFMEPLKEGDVIEIYWKSMH